MKPGPRRIELHIERLVLRGVDASDRDALVRALKAELQRQLAAPGVSERLLQTPHRARMQPPARQPGHAQTPQALASAAAIQLVGGL